MFRRGNQGSERPVSILRSRRSKQGMSRRVLVLRVIWMITIFSTEFIHFDRSIKSCTWPSIDRDQQQQQQKTRIRGGGMSKADDDQVFKVLLIADPQLPSIPYSYPTRSYPLQVLSIEIIYQFIRKSWKLLILSAKPDAIFFLGDLLDAGVATLDPIEFQAYLERFRKTFVIPENIKRTLKTDSPRLVYIAGNHDVGLYPDTSIKDSNFARDRFMRSWPTGKLNGAIDWGNHSMIWIDSMKMVEESKFMNEINGGGDSGSGDGGEVTKFLRKLTGPNMILPKVFFSHVPLWREEGTSCGPLRESRRLIKQGVGRNYQNEVPRDSTKFILETIQPVIVFSGDDHDYCEVEHQIPSTSLANPSPLVIPEISIKSFSMGMGVHRPGYHLLTLSNPSRYGRAPDEKTLSHKPCLLPDQIRLYTHIYLPLYILTLVIIFGPSVYKGFKRFTSTTRQMAKTNGLPIHHRPQFKHRKSLSRTLMFHKRTGSTLSTGSSSSEEGRKRSEEDEDYYDERSPSKRSSFAGRSRRSLSLGIGLNSNEILNNNNSTMMVDLSNEDITQRQQYQQGSNRSSFSGSQFDFSRISHNNKVDYLPMTNLNRSLSSSSSKKKKFNDLNNNLNLNEETRSGESSSLGRFFKSLLARLRLSNDDRGFNHSRSLSNLSSSGSRGQKGGRSNVYGSFYDKSWIRRRFEEDLLDLFKILFIIFLSYLGVWIWFI